MHAVAASAVRQPYRIPNNDSMYSPEQLKVMQDNWEKQERANALLLNPERAYEYDQETLFRTESDRVKRTGAKRRLSESK